MAQERLSGLIGVEAGHILLLKEYVTQRRDHTLRLVSATKTACRAHRPAGCFNVQQNIFRM